jgi:diguanylate cyclase (GGDEF)-like protein
VLVVHGDGVFRAETAALLGMAGWGRTEAARIAEAGVEPAVVVLALDLPGECAEARRRWPLAPVVLVGAAPGPDAEEMARLDAHLFHAVEDGPSRLLAMVEAALRHHDAVQAIDRQRARLRLLLDLGARLHRLRPTEEFFQVALDDFGEILAATGELRGVLFVAESERDGIAVCAGAGTCAGLTSRQLLPPAVAGRVTTGMSSGAGVARFASGSLVPVALGEEFRACLFADGVQVPDEAVETCQLYASQVAQALANTLLFERATVDGASRLCNRVYGGQRLSEALAMGARLGHPVAVLVLDVDELSAVAAEGRQAEGRQGEGGRAAADAVLRGVAGVLREGCRETDVLARHGPTTMLGVLPATGIDGAAIVAERVRAGVQRWGSETGGSNLQVSASIGVAAAPPGDRDGDALLARAEAALYRAQRAGRNCVRLGY